METQDRRLAGRRQWLAGLARAAALAGLGAITGMLVGRRPPAGGSRRCAVLDACRGCRILGRCPLPQAAEVRRRQFEQRERW